MKILSSIYHSVLISGFLLASFQVVASDTPIKVDANGEQLSAGTVSFLYGVTPLPVLIMMSLSNLSYLTVATVLSLQRTGR
ncbi:MAG: hypothetical protein ACLR17_18390 [Enterobacteriaceae bacterium]